MYPEKKPKLYGGDAFLLGQSPGEQQFGQAMQTLAPPTLAPGQKAQQGAEGQMWQGIEQQQQLGQAMASRRGYNPLAARAATAAGAEMESQGFGTAAQLRAAEEAQRRADVLGAYQARSAYDQAMAQLGQEQFGSALERKLYEDAMRRGIYNQQRAKEMAEKEGYLGALSGGLQIAGDVFQGLLGSDPNMKQNMAPAGNEAEKALAPQNTPTGDKDVDRAMMLFNPIGTTRDGGWAGLAGKAMGGLSGTVRALLGGNQKMAQLPGPGDVPIKDAELFRWSAEQSKQAIPEGALQAALGSGGIANLGSQAGQSVGGGLAGLAKGFVGMLSDENMKQNMAPAGELVEEAVAMPGDEGYRGVEQIYGILGEQPEQVVNGARMQQSGEYGSPSAPRTVTMYLGNKGNAQVVRQGGEVDPNAEMSPWQSLVASGRAKAAPVVVAAVPSGMDYASQGVALSDIGEGGPANTITRVEATPKKAAAKVEAPSPSELLKALEGTDAEMMKKLGEPVAAVAQPAKQANREVVFAPDQIVGVVPSQGPSYGEFLAGPFYKGQSITDELMQRQEARRRRALAEQMDARATKALEAVKAAPSTDEIVKMGADEFLREAEKSLAATGQVDVESILSKPLPDYKNPAEVDQFLDGIRPLSYEYKPSAMQNAARYGVATPAGRQLGITTQDMKKSALGSQAVVQTPAGEAVDIPRATSLLLAGQARMNKRLRDLEGK